MDLELCYY